MDEKWRILLINSKKSDPNFYICLQVRNALQRHADVERVELVDYTDAITVARNGSFNLLIVYGGESINRPIIYTLKKFCGTSAVWFTEDPYELSNNIRQSDLFDCVFTNDPGSVSKYPCPACFLPLASSEEFHYHEIPESDEDYRYDVSFIGTAWPNRTEFIRSLLKAKPELKYKLALPANEFLPPVNLPVPRCEINWRTPNSELAKIANVSKFSLILHREFSASGNDAKAESPGPRLFEIAMAGGLLLVDDSLDMNSELFIPGEEYLPFKDIKECVQQIEYFSQKPEERKKILEASQKRAIQNHTYDQRIDTLLETLNSHKTSEVSQLITQSNPKKKRLLKVVHNVINVQPFGGVEVYVDGIVKKLKDNYEIFFLIPNKQKDRQKSYLVLDADYNELEELNFSSPINGNWLSEPERESRFFDLLVKYQIDIVHYHHLIDHIPSLPLISRTLGIKSVFSIQDFYYLCDSFNLYNEKHTYCDVRNRCIETCDVCAFKRAGFAAGMMKKRRAFFERVLKSTDVVIGYSQTTKSYYERIYKGLDNMQVMPLPTPIVDGDRPVGKQLDKIKVAILGNFTTNKGAEVYLDMFRAMADDDLEFHIYGSINDHYSHILKVWNLKNVFIHQGYDVSELKHLLKDMNVSLHLSTWPETFLLTLSEAWYNNLVPIVSDIGAQGERVTHGVDGFVVPLNDCGGAIHTLRRLKSDPELFQSIVDNIAELDVTGVDQHVEILEEIYEGLECEHIEEYPEGHSDMSLKSLSQGLISDTLVQHTASDPEPVDSSVLVIDKSYPEARLQQKLRKAYRFYRSNGIKKTCSRIVAELKR